MAHALAVNDLLVPLGTLLAVFQPAEEIATGAQSMIEIAATEAAVVTVGALQAGAKENVIPDEALLKLSADPEAYRKARAAGRMGDLPTNHNPRFAPVLHPTLRTGVEAAVTAAMAWLSP